ncbi:MAG: hypothetical protein DRJ38_00130 [Thermoprotei archaeon]|nr:MAG: hypothetical protein DRJ38_00130 [Thermoprotei archaeon]
MSVNAFYRCADRVRYLMRFRNFERLFGGYSTEARRTIERCIDDMVRMANGTRMVGDVAAVNKVADVLLDRVTRMPITPYMKDFSEQCCLLLYNWNQSIENTDAALTSKLRAIDRLVKAHYTIMDAINVLRRLVRGPYVPAAYELSRHYLEVMRDEGERAGQTCPEKGSTRKS